MKRTSLRRCAAGVGACIICYGLWVAQISTPCVFRHFKTLPGSVLGGTSVVTLSGWPMTWRTATLPNWFGPEVQLHPMGMVLDVAVAASLLVVATRALFMVRSVFTLYTMFVFIAGICTVLSFRHLLFNPKHGLFPGACIYFCVGCLVLEILQLMSDLLARHMRRSSKCGRGVRAADNAH